MTNAQPEEKNNVLPSIQEMSIKDLREQINHLEDGVILLISLSEQEESLWT